MTSTSGQRVLEVEAAQRKHAGFDAGLNCGHYSAHFRSPAIAIVGDLVVIEVGTCLDIVDGTRGVLHPHHNVVAPRVTGVGNVGLHAVAAFVGALVHGVDDSASATKKAIECRMLGKSRICAATSAFDPGKKTTVWNGGLPLFGSKR